MSEQFTVGSEWILGVSDPWELTKMHASEFSRAVILAVGMVPGESEECVAVRVSPPLEARGSHSDRFIGSPRHVGGHLEPGESLNLWSVPPPISDQDILSYTYDPTLSLLGVLASLDPLSVLDVPRDQPQSGAPDRGPWGIYELLRRLGLRR